MNLAGLGQARINLGFMDRIRNTLHRPDLRPAWKEARPILRADQRAHAKEKAGPGGSWPARASETRARSGRNGRARRLMGRLPTATRQKDEKLRKIMSSIVAWSEAHMTGGRVGHGAVLPKREFLYVSQPALDKVAGIIAKGLAFLIEAS